MCMVRLVTSHVHIGTHVCNINLNMHKDKEMCSADNLHNNLLNTTDKLQDKCTITKEMCENTNERTDFLPNSTNFINKMFTDKSLRHKFVHTGCVCLSMVALGWRLSMTGPVLPDLRLILNEDLSRASWFISAMALGGLAGSLCFGALYDRFNKYAVFVGVNLALAAATVATPWCSSFVAMVTIHAVNGACCSGIDTINSADTVSVWKHKSPPYLQAVNLFFSVGAMISPLSVEPFLARQHLVEIESNTINGSGSVQHTFTPGSINNATFGLEQTSHYNNSVVDGYVESGRVYGETHIHFAFLISGIISLLACLSFAIQYCFIGSVHKIQTYNQINSTNISKKRGECQYPLNRSWRIVFLLLLSALLSTYVISERTFYSYLMTYLVERLEWDKAAGSKATTVFWIMLMLGRILSIVIVKVLRLLFVFVLFFGILLLGEVLMLISVRFSIPALIWVSCGLYGLGFSALFACTLSWLSAKVCPLTGKVCSVVFTITAIGSTVFPHVTGNVMEDFSYDWFIYLEMILTCVMILLLAVAEVLYHVLTKTTDTRETEKMSTKKTVNSTSL